MNTKIKYTLPIFVLLFSGCVQKTEFIKEFVSEPEGALITIDNKDVGNTPLSIKFDDNLKENYQIAAKLDGYFTEKVQVSRSDMASEVPLRFDLAKSPLWEATSVSAATNQWLILAVGVDAENLEVWNQILDSVTKRSSELSGFDYRSGYMEGRSISKRFQTVRGEIVLRSRFVAVRTSEDPLTYKIKVFSEWSQGQKWYPYNRILNEDKRLVDELFARFSA